MATEVEIGWIHLQGKGHQELMELKAHEARKDPPLQREHGHVNILISFQSSSLQNCEGMHFYFFKSPNLCFFAMANPRELIQAYFHLECYGKIHLKLLT